MADTFYQPGHHPSPIKLNSKGHVLEMLAQRSEGLPKTAFHRTGPDHLPAWTASIVYHNREYTSPMPCKTAKEAEQEAFALLERELKSVPDPTLQPHLMAPSEFVSRLQALQPLNIVITDQATMQPDHGGQRLTIILGNEHHTWHPLIELGAPGILYCYWGPYTLGQLYAWLVILRQKRHVRVDLQFSRPMLTQFVDDIQRAAMQ